MKDAFAYFLFNCYFTSGPKILYQFIGIPMGSDPTPSLPTYSYIISIWTRNLIIYKITTRLNMVSK